MPRQVDIDEFLDPSDQAAVIDVRSPSEFSQGHIVGAVNIPLFSDGERAEVGTCYQHQGRQDAILLGLDLVGPKMGELARALQDAGKMSPHIHCWRGGMRSSSVAWLAEQAGLTPTVLIGGYKAYRRAAQTSFSESRSMIVLSGMTGAGKTDRLHELAQLGEQVLDLEGLANHRGSSFGSLGLPPQPTCEQFENFIYEQLRHFHSDRPIWVEDESPSIGRVRVPHALWLEMRDSPAVFLDVDREDRATNLVREYGNQSLDGLQEASQRLERRLGGARLQSILASLESGDVFQVAMQLLEYYDKTYKHAATRKPRKHVQRVPGNVSLRELREFGYSCLDAIATS